jgi:hypothetical protein
MVHKPILIIWNQMLNFKIFMKIENHFNHLDCVYLHLSTMWCTFLLCKYILTSHHLKLKNVFFWHLTSLDFDLPYYAKIMWIFSTIMTWWQCDNNLGTPIMCFCLSMFLDMIVFSIMSIMSFPFWLKTSNFLMSILIIINKH